VNAINLHTHTKKGNSNIFLLHQVNKTFFGSAPKIMWRVHGQNLSAISQISFVGKMNACACKKKVFLNVNACFETDEVQFHGSHNSAFVFIVFIFICGKI